MPPIPLAATPNYSFNLPTVGGDTTIWGGLLNANWTAADTLFKAVNDAVAAGVDITVATIAPVSPKVGDLWMNSTTAVLYVWSGSVWLRAVPDLPPVTNSAVAPVSPVVGQLWFSTVAPVGLYVWHSSANGSFQWVQTNGGNS